MSERREEASVPLGISIVDGATDLLGVAPLVVTVVARAVDELRAASVPIRPEAFRARTSATTGGEGSLHDNCCQQGQTSYPRETFRFHAPQRVLYAECVCVLVGWLGLKRMVLLLMVLLLLTDEKWAYLATYFNGWPCTSEGSKSDEKLGVVAARSLPTS